MKGQQVKVANTHAPQPPKTSRWRLFGVVPGGQPTTANPSLRMLSVEGVVVPFRRPGGPLSHHVWGGSNFRGSNFGKRPQPTPFLPVRACLYRTAELKMMPVRFVSAALLLTAATSASADLLTVKHHGCCRFDGELQNSAGKNRTRMSLSSRRTRMSKSILGMDL